MNTDKIQKQPMITFTYYEPNTAPCEEEFCCLKEIEIREVKCVKPVTCLEMFKGLDMEELVTFNYEN